jgi:hypothetical protein
MVGPWVLPPSSATGGDGGTDEGGQGVIIFWVSLGIQWWSNSVVMGMIIVEKNKHSKPSFFYHPNGAYVTAPEIQHPNKNFNAANFSVTDLKYHPLSLN